LTRRPRACDGDSLRSPAQPWTWLPALLPGDLPALNDLAAAHGAEAMTAALERAVAFRRWRADDVRAILAAGPGVRAVTAAGADLDTGLPASRQHDLAAYAIGTLS
jgi:hypothetical protein